MEQPGGRSMERSLRELYFFCLETCSMRTFQISSCAQAPVRKKSPVSSGQPQWKIVDQQLTGKEEYVQECWKRYGRGNRFQASGLFFLRLAVSCDRFPEGHEEAIDSQTQRLNVDEIEN